MAVHRGALHGQNIRDVAAENDPSAYWVNRDDYLRDLIDAHPVTDIARLSTASKLAAIGVPMDGWISDADVAAIGKICRSVATKTEADTIRAGIDPLDFPSLGQRTWVRLAFANMP
jgi:hypothetical protein